MDRQGAHWCLLAIYSQARAEQTPRLKGQRTHLVQGWEKGQPRLQAPEPAKLIWLYPESPGQVLSGL